MPKFACVCKHVYTWTNRLRSNIEPSINRQVACNALSGFQIATRKSKQSRLCLSYPSAWVTDCAYVHSCSLVAAHELDHVTCSSVDICCPAMLAVWEHAQECNCCCRLPWGEGLLGLAPTQEERSPLTGQLLFRGLSAKVGIFHGPIVKLCPHSTTGLAITALSCQPPDDWPMPCGQQGKAAM